MAQNNVLFFREPSTGGLLLLDSGFRLLHMNREAVDILAYPENPRNINSLEEFLERKISSLLRVHTSSSRFPPEVVSGRRRYRCRMFSLNGGSGGNAAGDEPVFAVLIERPLQVALDTESVAQKFRLTERERETMGFLLQGFTSKEIAAQMGISPNTVKAFIKLIMMKTGTSTRSAIVGKVLPLAARPL